MDTIKYLKNFIFKSFTYKFFLNIRKNITNMLFLILAITSLIILFLKA